MQCAFLFFHFHYSTIITVALYCLHFHPTGKVEGCWRGRNAYEGVRITVLLNGKGEKDRIERALVSTATYSL